jgi:hypothetical protein
VTNAWGLGPSDLTGLAGAPFTQDQIDRGVATVVQALRWHLAPEVSETLTLDVDPCTRLLRLPTQRLVSLSAVRDTDTDLVIDASLYRVSLNDALVMRKCGFWPHGLARLEVDIAHGFDTVPPELLAVVAEVASLMRRDQLATTFGAGPFSVAYGTLGWIQRTENPVSTAAVLDRYTFWPTGLS